MINAVKGLALLALLVPPQDDPAAAALKKLAAKLGTCKTLLGSFAQVRKTELMEEPLKSSGRFAYRRDPERLVFEVAEPRKAEIHFDGTCYQVHRPEEKQLERFEFEDPKVAKGLFLAFHPDEKSLKDSTTVKLVESKDGVAVVSVEPKDPAVAKFFSGLKLSIVEADGALKGISYSDGQGDEVTFTFTDVVVDGEVPAGRFELKVPEGTTIRVQKVKA